MHLLLRCRLGRMRTQEKLFDVGEITRLGVSWRHDWRHSDVMTIVSAIMVTLHQNWAAAAGEWLRQRLGHSAVIYPHHRRRSLVRSFQHRVAN